MAISNIYRAVLATVILACFLGACQTPQLPHVNLLQSQESFEITALDGSLVSLSNTIQNHDATVIIWWSSQCPCVRRYQSRMESLYNTYPKDRVAVIALSSNANETPAMIQNVAKERGFTLPVFIDKRARLANAFSIRTTPTVVIIDRQGNLRFRGWIDNEHRETEAGHIPYLKNAINAILNNQSLAHDQSPAFGCMITKSMS